MHILFLINPFSLQESWESKALARAILRLSMAEKQQDESVNCALRLIDGKRGLNHFELAQAVDHKWELNGNFFEEWTSNSYSLLMKEIDQIISFEPQLQQRASLLQEGSNLGILIGKAIQLASHGAFAEVGKTNMTDKGYVVFASPLNGLSQIIIKYIEKIFISPIFPMNLRFIWLDTTSLSSSLKMEEMTYSFLSTFMKNTGSIYVKVEEILLCTDLNITISTLLNKRSSFVGEERKWIVIDNGENNTFKTPFSEDRFIIESKQQYPISTLSSNLILNGVSMYLVGNDQFVTNLFSSLILTSNYVKVTFQMKEYILIAASEGIGMLLLSSFNDDDHQSSSSCFDNLLITNSQLRRSIMSNIWNRPKIELINQDIPIPRRKRVEIDEKYAIEFRKLNIIANAEEDEDNNKNHQQDTKNNEKINFLLTNSIIQDMNLLDEHNRLIKEFFENIKSEEKNELEDKIHLLNQLLLKVPLNLMKTRQDFLLKLEGCRETIDLAVIFWIRCYELEEKKGKFMKKLKTLIGGLSISWCDPIRFSSFLETTIQTECLQLNEIWEKIKQDFVTEEQQSSSLLPPPPSNFLFRRVQALPPIRLPPPPLPSFSNKPNSSSSSSSSCQQQENQQTKKETIPKIHLLVNKQGKKRALNHFIETLSNPAVHFKQVSSSSSSSSSNNGGSSHTSSTTMTNATTVTTISKKPRRATSILETPTMILATPNNQQVARSKSFQPTAVSKKLFETPVIQKQKTFS